MAYERTQYHREVQREDDRDTKQGGWKSWFGLGSDNKDHEERDRGYSYSNTTTYRNQQPSSYGYPSSDRYATERSGYTGGVSGGYSGSRGGYGYTTSDEVNRGPSWNTDRDYNTRSGYGTTGDRDLYYKQETRTYGGDNFPTRRTTGEYNTPSRNYGGEYTTPSRPYGGEYTTPSRAYGFSGEQRPASRGIYGAGPTGPTGYTSGPSGYTSEQYPSRYPITGDNSSRYQTVGGDRDLYYKKETRTYGGDYNEPSSRNYGYSGERDTGRNYGYAGETTRGTTGGYGGDYPRASYQQSTYRY